jgi:membrane protein
MISQAVAFNMFLAFFAILLIALGAMKNSLEGQNGPDLALTLSRYLPPGSWQLVSGSVLQPEVNSWYLTSFGWVGMLLVGSQMIKLIIKGIETIYGDREKHSFLGRQLRGLFLFVVTSVVWFGAIALVVFGPPVSQWLMNGPSMSRLAHGMWTVTLSIFAMLVVTLILSLIYRFARPKVTTWISVLPGAAAGAVLWWAFNVLFGIYVRKTQYGPVYGGLAAAIGLMVWMEFSAMLVFFGAAWNAENAAQYETNQNPTSVESEVTV